MKSSYSAEARATSTAGAFQRWLREVGEREVVIALAELDSDAAVFVVDEDRRILYWSSGAESLLGFSRDEVVGEHCLKANRCQACMVGCNIAEQGSVQQEPLVLHRSDGQTVAVLKNAQAFFDERGVFKGGVEWLRPRRGEEKAAPSTVLPHSREVITFHGLVSRDPAMLRVFQTIRNVAETDTTVLVRGESGTGKELVARAIHEESHRKGGPFLAVNCAALTPTLLESELFGHVKGAFTGAAKDRVGLFEQANRGTLFLDEVAELSMDVQAKLLRVLEEREVVPVGSNKAIEVDVRVVAATHRALRKETKAGRFREDLMYRLRVVPLFLPALRERLADIELLLWHFIKIGNKQGPRRVRAMAPNAMRALLHHDWPGNVREMRNVVEYAFAVGRDETVQLNELPPEFSEGAASIGSRLISNPGNKPGNKSGIKSGLQSGIRLAGGRSSARSNTTEGARAAGTDRTASANSDSSSLTASEAEERDAIAHALEVYEGHLGRIAEALGISRPTLWRKRKKYGL